MPRGNATKEMIEQMGYREGQMFYKCPKCCSIKPDRAHHCSVCQRCIRKMDHHCPWVNNCVGENNQKYFVLLRCVSQYRTLQEFLTNYRILFAVLYCVDVGAHALYGNVTVCGVREKWLANMFTLLTASYHISVALSYIRGPDVWHIHHYNVVYATECDTQRSNGASDAQRKKIVQLLINIFFHLSFTGHWAAEKGRGALGKEVPS